MTGAANQEAMEREIFQLQEASVTSDGMLSCYTPFLLAIIQRRLSDSRDFHRRPITVGSDTCSGDPGENEEHGQVHGKGQEKGGKQRHGHHDGGEENRGGDQGQSQELEGRPNLEEGQGHVRKQSSEVGDYPGNASGVVGNGDRHNKGEEEQSLIPPPPEADCCPASLCAEALWSLSEYAVLSPGLAGRDLLPMAETLARDTAESWTVREAAARVWMRPELVTDETALRVLELLEDPDRVMRRDVLVRLGRLISESRIKRVHLSHFAPSLVDWDECVRNAAEGFFMDYLRPQADSVCRCLLETFLTLPQVVHEGDRRRDIIQRLLAIARLAAPACRLGNLGGPLMRRVTGGGVGIGVNEGRDGDDVEDAAYILSLVPPTLKSFEAAETAYDRGVFAHTSPASAALVMAHFNNNSGGETRRTTAEGSGGAKGLDDGHGTGVSDLLPKGKCSEMAKRLVRFTVKGRHGASPTNGVSPGAKGLNRKTPRSHETDVEDGGVKGSRGAQRGGSSRVGGRGDGKRKGRARGGGGRGRRGRVYRRSVEIDSSSSSSSSSDDGANSVLSSGEEEVER